MPFASIALARAHSPDRERAIADVVHEAVVEAVGSPPDDRFQLVQPLSANLIYDPHYPQLTRSDDFMLIQLSVFPGKPVEAKQRIVATMARRIAAGTGISAADIMIILHEIPRENWSFGAGILQHAPAPRAAAAS